ncbi:MAG: hypothetical protein IJ298_06090 [Ruminococcus sp.]|nr:hypothetical protein [Ruminococcus sp.]
MENNKQNEFLSMLSQKLGKSPEEIKSSAQAGNIDALTGNLSPQQQTKLKSILSDPEQTRKIMENPQVQALIRMLSSNG